MQMQMRYVYAYAYEYAYVYVYVSADVYRGMCAGVSSYTQDLTNLYSGALKSSFL